MNFHPRRRRMPTVIIVSLIDIFAILLIFVIVTSTFKKPQAAVTIRLPESAQSTPQALAETHVELAVTANGALFLDGRPVEARALAEELRALKAARRPLALKADDAAPFGTILRVLDAMKAAGIAGSLPTFAEKPGR